MKKTIITVSREFGSGGRTIAKAVADALSIPCYDKELINQVVEETGLSPDYIENAGEHSAGKTVFSYWMGPRNFKNGMSVSDFLWCMQCKVIQELAEKESCVIVGRCADFVLKDFPEAFHVFIHANPEFRAERIVRLYGESEKAPLKRLTDKDDKRRAHYKHYTGRAWGKYQNYHLSLDSGVIGIETCASIITELTKAQFTDIGESS